MAYTLALFTSITSFIWLSISHMVRDTVKKEPRYWLYILYINNVGLSFVLITSLLEIIGYYNKFTSLFSLLVYLAVIGIFASTGIIVMIKHIIRDCSKDKPRVVLTTQNIMVKV
jgi:hypothetical protein